MTTPDRELNWSIFDDRQRLDAVLAIDEVLASHSESLRRATRLAAAITSSQYSQLSLIGADQFVPAAHGLVYADEQQHTSLRDSLCGVTMASQGTLVVHDSRSHPWVKDLPPVASGLVGSYLGVPLVLDGGEAIGSLCAFNSTQREWTDADRAALEDLAMIVARELHLLAALHNAQSSEVMLRQIVADMVDRPRSALTGPLQAAARYRVPSDAPAGGDWVDWTPIDEHRTTFGIGDVAGHGLDAVVTMDDLRHTLRAFAVEGGSPGDVIRRADAHLRAVAPRAIASAMKLVFHHQTGIVNVSCAGHPPPILMHGGAARIVTVTPNPPLGCGIYEPHSSAFEFPLGARLVLVTDGLFERRGEAITDSMARLVTQVAETDGLGTEAAADHLIALARGPVNLDDACVLVVDRGSS